jgi:hypothetical protein
MCVCKIGICCATLHAFTQHCMDRESFTCMCAFCMCASACAPLHVRVHRRAEELIHVPQARQARMQVLKRFTGGGTVVVDSNTVFASLIFNVS